LSVYAKATPITKLDLGALRLRSFTEKNSTLFHERDRKLGKVNDLRCNRPHDEIADRTHAACSHHNPVAGQALGTGDN
jgi:hypothetical protein